MKTKIPVIITLILMTFIGCGNSEKPDKTAEQQTKVSVPKLDLHAAVYMKDLEAIRRHIKAGSDLNVLEPSRESTPLITAAALNVPEAAALLIDAGADLNYKNLDGSTALQTAVVFGNTEVAKILIDAGSDLNIKNSDGSTPLHTSAFLCRLEIVKTLLENGADKNITNNRGKTAFEIVKGPFEDAKGIYDAIGEGLKPLGIELDYDHIRKTRPIIAEMLN